MRHFAISMLLGLIASPCPNADADEPNESVAVLRSRVTALGLSVSQLKAELAALKQERMASTSTHSIEKRLNGRWVYVSSEEDGRVTSYEGDKVELLIDNGRWITLTDGRPDLAGPQVVEYNFRTNPVSVTRACPKWAPDSIARCILRIDGDHLVYTTTPLEDPKLGNGFTGSPAADPLYPMTPKMFDPKGTGNCRYVLRRVSRSTKLPATEAANPSGGSAGF